MENCDVEWIKRHGESKSRFTAFTVTLGLFAVSLVVVVLPDPFRGMGARRPNNRTTPQVWTKDQE